MKKVFLMIAMFSALTFTTTACGGGEKGAEGKEKEGTEAKPEEKAPEAKPEEKAPETKPEEKKDGEAKPEEKKDGEKKDEKKDEKAPANKPAN